MEPVVPGSPRLVRYGKILFDNFAILVGVIRRHVVGAESTAAPRLFTAFIHGLKSRGILRRRIKILLDPYRRGRGLQFLNKSFTFIPGIQFSAQGPFYHFCDSFPAFRPGDD